MCGNDCGGCNSCNDCNDSCWGWGWFLGIFLFILLILLLVWCLRRERVVVANVASANTKAPLPTFEAPKNKPLPARPFHSARNTKAGDIDSLMKQFEEYQQSTGSARK